VKLAFTTATPFLKSPADSICGWTGVSSASAKDMPASSRVDARFSGFAFIAVILAQNIPLMCKRNVKDAYFLPMSLSMAEAHSSPKC